MQAIAFTGLARSGKDTAADYLVKKYGFHKLVLSDVLAEELRKKGRPVTKMNRSLIAEELREKSGKDVLAKEVVARAEEKKWKKAVFTGVHQIAEVEFFRKNIGEFHLFAIRAENEKRFGRKTKLDAQSREKFFERDRHDTTEFELSKVIATADYTIGNNSTINELYKAIDELMQKI